MYRKNRKITSNTRVALGSYKRHTIVYRPISYYILGGTDLTGKALADEAISNFDSKEDIENHCGVDSLCNPRESVWNIVERLGVEKATQVVRDVAKMQTE